MIVKNIILCFLTIFLPIPSNCVSQKSVEYYENLLQEFMQNASHWEHPTDSRRFFKLINESAESIHHGHYDFIIVGAGVAGSVLSNRLTESGRFKVLLLEAGGQENDFTDVPGFATYLIRSDFNWGYQTIPQTNSCLGMKNKQCNYPRGKVVGGSSVINNMKYVRGSKKDFDIWGSENPGWDYKSVLPYFKKSENSTLDFEDPGYHGHHGPVSVESARYHPAITDVFLKSVQENGRSILDYNGRNETGYSRFQMMTKKGKRCSASKAYVKPAIHRKNLELLYHTLGIKILIKYKKAYGVEFIRNGKKYKATASTEVIISGGSINSPQILMLSGIGPEEHLEELEIPVIQDLPVGKNFQDHQLFPALFFSTNISTKNQPSTEERIKHYLEGYGFLTVSSGVTAVGFESSKLKTKNPRAEYQFLSAKAEELAPFFEDFVQMTEENSQAILKPLLGKYVWGVDPVFMHPKSAGSIKLKTKDPLDYPLIDSNLYSDKNGDDMKEMLAIIKNVFEISETPAFQSIDSKYLSDPFPACSDFQHFSEEYWKCALRQVTQPFLHGVGSCKMGPKSDNTAVVDNELKVYGICGLRVADASVIPFSISANPTPAIYMIGEKASDLIRKEYGDF
ncbi:hypothetical protein ILUMI_06175 [Ignelater luminosus]|uniref:Glucose-methanol-choline oxidoreductase N-terminal domain-containing protein n=1 Tax=Ignelater luminosus TaxID=2038154 RepID=A0A8K0D9R9_IGNLU|nr:hypothetical protein ILUMI_06175 [Ignelater luminosus]